MVRFVRIIGCMSLLVMTSYSLVAEEYDALLTSRNERITKKVEEEVSKQLETMQRKVATLQTKLDEYRNRNGSSEEVVHGFKAPWLFSTFNSWKEYLREQPDTAYLPEKQIEEAQFRLQHSWGRRAYGVNGNTKDLSTLVFGAPSFLFKDVFLGSKLLETGEASILEDASKTLADKYRTEHYLYILADQELAFNASFNRQVFDLSFERLFRNKRLAVRLNVPIVREEHRLELSKDSEITTANRTRLTAVGAKPAFYQKFDKMQDFLEKTFIGSGVAFKKTQEEIGIGDISAAASYICKIRYIDQASVGASLSLGTGKVNRGVTIWQPELGNSGGNVLQVFGDFAWHRGLFANPYVRLQVGYNFPVRIACRVPRTVSHDTGNANKRFVEVLGRELPWSEVLIYNNVAFADRHETQMCHVGSHLQRVMLYRGLEATFVIGNNCEQCFGRPIKLGLQYELFLREQESLSGLDKQATYATEVVTVPTHRVAHTLQATAGYRFSDTCELNGAFSYCVGGRNVPAQFGLNAALTVRF